MGKGSYRVVKANLITRQSTSEGQIKEGKTLKKPSFFKVVKFFRYKKMKNAPVSIPGKNSIIQDLFLKSITSSIRTVRLMHWEKSELKFV